MAPPRKKRKKKGESDKMKTKEALLTIQRLSRKYLHKSPNVSANDRGIVELSLPSPVIDSESNENSKQKLFNLSHTQTTKPKRLSKRIGAKTHVLAPSKSGNVSPPRVKALKPKLRHSTPKEVTAASKTENSLVGYESMQTPSGVSPSDLSPSGVSPSDLSPNMSEADGLDSTKSSVSLPTAELELSVKRDTRPYNAPNKRRRKKQAGFSEAEVKKWVCDMNQQFNEVDNFQLLIE